MGDAAFVSNFQVVFAGQLDWTSSPSDGVVRKRLYHRGSAESGVVTSLVRYRPGAHFERHYHPKGEEILVLEGVFSDEHGDFPAGSYLLNPPGSGHRPFSAPGCLLLVKLNQYYGEHRAQVAIDTRKLKWQILDRLGLKRKVLYRQSGFSDRVSLLRLEANTRMGPLIHARGAEIFVVEGGYADEHGIYPAGSWLRLPPGHHHSPVSEAGCVLYLKTD
jgi:anti-sigma factor ChrR (cupin superfamily)